MSDIIREDKTCLNCLSVVEKKYCPECGQKNIQPRQSFVHLVTHFFEDFTHYDNAFWKTIRHLLFHPARLTQEYLAGRRQKYVPPVRLYIFISFVTFLVLSWQVSSLDVSQEVEVSNGRENNLEKDYFQVSEYGSTREFDSIQKTLPREKRVAGADEWWERKLLALDEKYKARPGDFFEDILSQTVSLLPKILFLYLPVFTLLLWLIHNKKRWFFFDHGIFTLHYFSFLLLTFLLSQIPITILDWVWAGNGDILLLILMPWWIFYFFRAHSKMYGEKKWTSRLKSSLLFLVNSVIILILLIAAMVYALLTL